MFRSLLLSFAARMIDRRTSFMPLMISFPSIGFIVTTSSTIIGLTIMHFYSKSDKMV
ncbi:protein of unknown function [Nitrosotalea devaniterrae]|uniref:Uncharacterized protein n=1 Tax=Nitrosotalea devaniterrae TaxID=1078905 RepID=A0A128A4A6_9ARCH|nr:protein of unknown function [Candidatus Nitrosotalea devanaterra]